jgi:3-phosphoshikimate 1-carboxyvinyltransferase
MMESLVLEPAGWVNGEINLPGSKSLSNRILLLAAIAEGVTGIENLLCSDDTTHMLNALQRLGVSCELAADRTRCRITGKAGGFITTEPIELFLGNAGTAMRPLCAVLSASSGEYILTGEPRMEERPIGPLVDCLLQAGAGIHYLKNAGYPPLKIIGQGMKGGRVSINGSLSSQFLTAVLMAAPLARQDTEIVVDGELVSRPYIDMTLHMLAQFGVACHNRDYKTFTIKGNQLYRSPGRLLVEGDATSASYFLAAAAIKGGEVKVTGVGRKSVQGDIGFADVLKQMGAGIEWGDDYIIARKGELKGIDMDLNHIPDAAMTIAVTALFARGQTVIRNIYNWRVKETDRLRAMAAELRKTGAEIEEGEDYLVINPPDNLQHAVIDTYNDHRMAMSFSLLSLSDASVTINDPGCTSKTFPDYFIKLASITHPGGPGGVGP